MSNADQNRIRLGSYNIRAGLGTDMRRDPDRTLAAIDALNLDVAVLQEADFRMGARPTALPVQSLMQTTGLVPISQRAGSDSLGWHGIGILAKPDVVVQDVARFDLPGLEPRGALLAELDTSIGPLRVIGVHLGLLRRSRRAQLSHLRDIIADRASMPTVMAGDFNEWSLRRGLGRLNADYRIVTPGPSFPSRYPALSLDRFVHSDDLMVSAEPVRRSKRGPHASDHLPIVAHIHRNRHIQTG